MDERTDHHGCGEQLRLLRDEIEQLRREAAVRERVVAEAFLELERSTQKRVEDVARAIVAERTR